LAGSIFGARMRRRHDTDVAVVRTPTVATRDVNTTRDVTV
jgi:hypothetical protein